MASRTSIVVNDRESTPVAHTFVPTGSDDNLAIFAEKGVVPRADRRLTVGWKLNGTRKKVRIVLSDPKVVTETINGADVTRVPYRNFADVTFTFDEGSSLQERQNLVGMFANLLADSVAVVDSTVTGLEEIW